MARRDRSNPEWQALITEHQILKRKLQSKSEALLIISKDLDTAQNERDQFKLMAEKLQERCQAYKRQQADFPLNADQAKLLQMLKDVRNQKLAHQKQNEVLQQKLNEAIGDVKLLREKFARQTIGDEGIGARHFPLHEREKLVSQLEESQQQCEHWRKECESQIEVTQEALADRDGAREKTDRLNQELSYVLSGDKKRILDIDALCMENKYLKERITQCQAEKNSLHQQLKKFKNLLSSKKSNRSELPTSGASQLSSLVVSPKQIKQLLAKGISHNSPEQVADLQAIVSASLETLNDKNLAIQHLRNTNKILGTRVSELERKLKTCETGGLWNLQANGSSNPRYSGGDLLPDYNAADTIPADKGLKEKPCLDEPLSPDILSPVGVNIEDNIIQHHSSLDAELKKLVSNTKDGSKDQEHVSGCSSPSTESCETEEEVSSPPTGQTELKTSINSWLENSSLEEEMLLQDSGNPPVVSSYQHSSSSESKTSEIDPDSSYDHKGVIDEVSFTNLSQA